MHPIGPRSLTVSARNSPAGLRPTTRATRFVGANYAALKERRVFSAAIPEELGGGGASHREIADMLRTLAQYCGSTALALSMHQHLIAATVWKYRHGQGGEPMLKNVAEKQLVLVSTGAGRLAGVQRLDDQNRRRLSGQRPKTLCQPVRGRRHAGHECAVHGRGPALSGADERAEESRY